MREERVFDIPTTVAPVDNEVFGNAAVRDASRPVLAGPAQILLVEGDAPVRRRLGALLRRQGYLVAACGGRAEAESEARQTAPDAVIVELLLPRTSGADFVRWLRAQPALGTIPILLLSPFGATRDLQAALAIGANDIIVKPVSYATILARLNALLRGEVVPPSPTAASPTAEPEPLHE